MRVKKITLYTFDELSKEAQKKTIEEYRTLNVDMGEWWLPIYEEWEEKLETMGYEDPEISFSGFWSQGDGASFTCKKIDLLMWLYSHPLEIIHRFILLRPYMVGGMDSPGEITASLDRTNPHYCHARSISVHLDSGDVDSKLGDVTDDLEEFLNQEAEKLSREIYRDLEKYYNELCSDESVAEGLRANEYEFLKEGGKIQ